MAKGEGKVVAQNKKARHDYTIVDTIEAGMVLTGTEIKSIHATGVLPLCLDWILIKGISCIECRVVSTEVKSSGPRARRPRAADRPARPAPIGGLPRKIAAGE